MKLLLLVCICIFNECLLLEAFLRIPSPNVWSRNLRILKHGRRYISQGHRETQQEAANDGNEPTKIYFDIAIGGNSDESDIIGRLVFNLNQSERYLPLHSENLIKLATGELRSLDPRCSYLKCQFKHSPQFVETFPQYKWAHVMDGRGRNAIGRPTERIQDVDSFRSCTRSIYGGVYYGLEYDDELVENSEEGVVLTVPLVGPYRGSTSFSIVRVGESPQEWRERLLLNSAVLGYLESGIEVLREFARQTNGPPIIVRSGKI
eukprot:scaffold2719_cov266-Chaetoceros_neogracile.AAC.17